MSDHSLDFAALRDAVVDDLSDDDRRRLVGLFGCMTERIPPPSPALVRALQRYAALGDGDRRKFAGWCERWLSRFGQVPRAPGMRHEPRATRKPPPESA